jgi:hypothetical protein
MRHPPMSFCAGFYYYQGEVKNARKLRILDCRMQIAKGRGQQAEIRGQKTEIMLWERLSSRDITTLTISTISTISTT